MILLSLLIGVLNIFVAGIYLGTLAGDKLAGREIEKKNWFFSLFPLVMGVYVLISLIGIVALS